MATQNGNGHGVSKQVISIFESRDEFLNLLKVNPGLVIVKLGASWCGPCKKIAHIVDAFFAGSPPNVICADIDVDESIDLYSYLKHKRMVNGIPVILLYKRGNVSFAPDDSVTGADPGQLDAFFKRCGHHLAHISQAYAEYSTSVPYTGSVTTRSAPSHSLNVATSSSK